MAIFASLKNRLTLVATHLDSCSAVACGRAGWNHVPISKAVQASAALPGLFPPVEIDGQHDCDGALMLNKLNNIMDNLQQVVDVASPERVPRW